MEQLTSVSDIPLPGEDISRNELNHAVLQEANMSTEHNPEFNKPVENLTYTEDVPAYSTTSNVGFDENSMVINQQLQPEAVISENIISEDKVISQEDTNLINSIKEEIGNAQEENVVDSASQLLQESVMEVDQSQTFEQPVQLSEDIKNEHERQPTLAETVEDLQKFVEQTTQDAVVTANDNTIDAMEIVEETTDIITELPGVTTDTAKMITEPSEITETAEIRTETIENPTEITVNLDEIIDVPVHDNSVEIKDGDISSNNILINSSELEIISGNDGLDGEQLSVQVTQDQEQNVQAVTVEENRSKPELIETSTTTSSDANTGKRTIRRNSTIEAIKNDWSETDTLTIEEIKEEPESTSPKSTSSKSIAIIDDEPEPEDAQIQEIHPEEDSLTQVIVLQSVNDGLQLNLDQNVTIEIIDEIKSKDADIKNDPLIVPNTDIIIEESAKSNNSAKKGTIVIIPDKKVPVIESKNIQTISKNKAAKEERIIPCHLLGRNVDNPTEDLISNGRTPPKPRLGVKVPYRFLTSQIVTKQEITNELLEIHAKRNPERDPPAGGDIFFAKKLTQRLANKINQSEKVKKERIEQATTATSGIPEEALLTPSSSQSSESSNNNTKSSLQCTSKAGSKSINDNSDLLAILEGDVDVDLTKEIKITKLKSSDSTDTDNQIEKALENIANSPIVTSNLRKRKKMDPEMEREIALKQLESLPKEVKKSSVRKYGRRGRPFKYYGETISIMADKVQENEKKESEEVAPKENVGESSTSKKLAEDKIKSPPKTALELIQSKVKDVSDNVKEAAENIMDKIKKKKLKDISPKMDKTKKSDKTEEISDDLLHASLTPKKVSKTYSRKDSVVNVNVPADLEQIVNDQSALENEECIEEDLLSEKLKLKENEDKKNIKTPLSAQKRPKRSIAEDINTPEVTLVSKRARIIKPKIIWDPAESIPRKLKPQLATEPMKPKRGRPRKSLDNLEESPTKLEPETSKGESVVLIKKLKDADIVEKDVEAEIEEPKEKKEEKPLKILKKKGKLLSRAALNKVQAKKKILMKRQIRTVSGKLIRSTNGELKSSLALSKKKKQLVYKIAHEVKSANKPKTTPKKTELDKLLMDEGAVNMLYAVRQDEKVGKRNSSKLIPSKDLLNRTIALRKVITQSSINENTPTKALRKKESPNITPIKITQKERKKSRDSIRSSVHSPPPSPSYASNRAEASRIIRRHSSSFSSECSSPRRLSIDTQNLQENAEKEEVKVVEQKEDETKKEIIDITISPVRNLRRKGVPIYERKADEKTYKGKKKLLPEIDTTKESETPKVDKESDDRLTPTTEKPDKSEKPDKLSAAEKRKLNTEMSKNFSKYPLMKKRTRNSKTEDDEEQKKEEDKSGKAAQPANKSNKNEVEEKPKRTRHISVNSNFEEISLRKIDNLVQIILTPSNTKLKNSISIKMFKELNDALTSFAKDDTCRVVLLTSTDSSFCHGVDFSTLIQTNSEKRTNVVQEMAENLKNFLWSLAHFPKPIIAGVQGSAVGLGVTMLPLFDLVFASDKATFSTPYGRLGQVPEGIAFVTLPNLLGNTLTSELMFANRKLTASEAVHHGLVTRTIWPDKFQEDVLSSALAVSTQSGQSMQATKSLMRKSLLSKLDEALESESKLLISHWSSAECQQNFKKLLQEEEWW